MKKKGNKNLLLISIGIGLFSALLTLCLYRWSPTFLKEVDLRYSNFRFKLRGKVKPGPNVAIVAIDEKSINKLGRWPWSRRRLAELVEKLADYRPKAVAFDMTFSEPESDDADRVFSTALEKDRDVVLGYFFRESATQEPSSESLNQLSRSNVKLIDFLGKPEPNFLGEFPSVEMNIPQIGAHARGFGFFNFPNADTDGVFRRAQLLMTYKGEIYPSLDIEGIRHFLGEEILLKVTSYGVDSFYIGQTRIPTDERGEFLINYYGPGGMFPTYSFVDVLSGKVPPDALKNKLVFVGTTEIGVYDARSTPFDATFPGVEIHATVAENILNGRFLIKNDLTEALDIALLLILPMILVLLLMRAGKTFIAISIFFALLFIHLLGNYILFTRLNLLLSALYPALSLGFAYVFYEGKRNLIVERKGRYLRKAFSSYVSAELVAQIIQDPDKLKLGGEKRNVTMLFSDIRGFTSLSERMPPEALVSLLNEYLSPMTQIVMNERGTLDKYIGDAIMAIFGAPLDVPDHPKRACQAALQMIEELKKLYPKWKEKGWPHISIGVGINTGEAIVGNMGANMRFDYTAIGDAVNLASRLEGLNKLYGTQIIVSKSTLDGVDPSQFLVRELDLVRVKGKEKPVSIFELIGPSGDRQKEALVGLFTEAWNLYQDQEFYEAMEKFAEILKMFPEDKPSALYHERCLKYISQPPPPNWDGVYIAEEK
ncbi:MAG: CHASE2 domain-containing protein [Ignavibacteriales bacterium]